MKHTPRPWTVHWNAKDHAEIQGPRYPVALLNGYVSREELWANAQVLVVAPAMLEALQGLLIDVESRGDGATQEAEFARAIISQATKALEPEEKV